MNRNANTEVRHSSQVARGVTAAILALPLLAGCATPGATGISADSLSAVTVGQSTPASTAETEQAEIAAHIKTQAAAAKAAKKAAVAAAAAKAAEEAAAAKAAEQAAASKPASKPAPAKAAAAAPATSADFMGWVNGTLARYGVSPGPGASFVVGNTGFCGGYMCTTTKRYGTTPFESLTTVSPGAIGNNFALIHEVAHQHGVGFKDTGGECAADVWARQYVQGSIYC